MTRRHPSRREVLGTLGRSLALSPFGVPLLAPVLRAGPGRVPPSEQIGLGFIGLGGMGRYHLSAFLRRPEVRVVALCDVDRRHLEEAASQVEAPGLYTTGDFRRLLERADVDAVVIATPDHWHALIAIAAAEAGKDIYCEKPLTLTVAEGRALVQTVRRYGRVFQTGSQQRSDARFRRACELVRNGHIGRLLRISTAIGQGPTTPWEPPGPPPPELDWDMWLGPAPWQEYTPKRCHYNFRWFYDYSGGKMTDWGAHHNDIAQWALGADHSGPVEVHGRAEYPLEGMYETALRFDVWYRYENGVELHCTSEGRNGVTFEGSNGRIFVTRGAIEGDPPELLDLPAEEDPVRLYRSENHHGNWLECLRTRRRPICDVEVGHRSVTVCHLGNIAMRLGRPLRWDPRAERFPGDAEADRLLRRPMRQPWSL